jgi:hypothetical protein
MVVRAPRFDPDFRADPLSRARILSLHEGLGRWRQRPRLREFGAQHNASICGGGYQMDTSTIEREAKIARDDAMKLTAPLQTFWKMTFFDMPLAVASESMRFLGSRLQAHGEHLASLNSCRSVPEMLDMQSHFVRHTVDAYGRETSKIIKDVRSTANEVQNQVQNQMSKAA